MFAIVLSIPLLAFWTRRGWARTTIILTLLFSILACWWYFDLSRPGADLQVMLFAMTLIPAVLTALVAGAIEAKFRFDRMMGRTHHPSSQRRRKKSRSASFSAS
jgi:hypothetical protein